MGAVMYVYPFHKAIKGLGLSLFSVQVIGLVLFYTWYYFYVKDKFKKKKKSYSSFVGVSVLTWLLSPLYALLVAAATVFALKMTQNL